MHCHHCQTPTQPAQTQCTHCGVRLQVGEYTTTKLIRRGEVIWTYYASDGAQDVVIKELRADLAKSSEQQAQLEAERLLLQQLNDPRVPSMLAYVDATMAQPNAALIMERMPGESLAERMTHHRFSEDEVKNVLRSLLEVISRLHRLSPPVLHRDIKPSNVIINDDDEVSLVDLGIARDFDPKNDITISQGTVGYAPPEQMMGRVNMSSDLYSAGMTALHLLTRKEPEEILRDDLTVGVDDVTWLSPAFHQVLERLVAFQPSSRPQDAQTALQELTSGTAVKKVSASSPSRAQARQGGGAKWAVAAAAALVVVAGVAAGGWMLLSKAPAPVLAKADKPAVRYDLGNGVVLRCAAGLTHESEAQDHFCGQRKKGTTRKHGEWVRLRAHDGMLMQRRTYVDGLEQGVRETFENGKTKAKQSFAAGKATSPRKEFATWTGNGTKVVAEGEWDGNRRQGLWKEWDGHSGRLKAECNYVDGKKHGACKESWTEGHTKTTHYDQGQMHGAVVEKYGEQTTLEATYEHGRRHGKALAWHKNGNPKSKGAYENGSKSGDWQEFHPNGKPSAVGRYVRGRRMGKHTRYFDDGEVLSEFEYVSNERVAKGFEHAHGGGRHLQLKVESHEKNREWVVKTRYHWGDGKRIDTRTVEDLGSGRLVKRETFSKESKKRIKLENYKEHRRSGAYKEWWPNGKKKVVGRYDKDQKVGVWTHYSERGKKVGRHNYGKGR